MFDLSIIVINYKSKNLTKNCLKSIFDNLSGQEKYKIRVCVVDSSHDGTKELVAKNFPQAEFENLPVNHGFGNAANFSMKKWPARYYWILNPDMIFLEPNIAGRLIDWMDSHPDVGLAGPKLFYPDGTIQDSCMRFPKWYMPILRRTFLGKTKFGQNEISQFMMYEYDHKESREIAGWIIGTGMFIRDSAYQKVGGFDERFFMYFEDVDYCRRFWQAGFKVYYIADISAIHYHGRDSAVAKISEAHYRSNSSAQESSPLSVFTNYMTRVHIKSWMKYVWKWRNFKSQIINNK